MEKRLLNLYLKHIKETNKNVFEKVESPPAHFYVQMSLFGISFVVAIVSAVLSKGNPDPSRICMWAFLGASVFSIVVCVVFHISINKYEIDISEASMAKYWTDCADTKKWIVAELMPRCNKEEVISREIKRLKKRIDQYRKELISISEKHEARTDKLIQTLAIPFALAIITAVIDKNDNLTTVVVTITMLVIVGAIFFGSLWVWNDFKSLLGKQKTEQLKFFSDDLQGVLDLQHYKSYLEKDK